MQDVEDFKLKLYNTNMQILDCTVNYDDNFEVVMNAKITKKFIKYLKTEIDNKDNFVYFETLDDILKQTFKLIYNKMPKSIVATTTDGKTHIDGEYKSKNIKANFLVNVLKEKNLDNVIKKINKNTDGFQKIKLLSNWGSCDSIDGEALKDGEQIEVKWPNGDVGSYIISDESRTYNCGHPGDTATDIKSYIEINHKGFESKIRVLGLYARRLKEK